MSYLIHHRSSQSWPSPWSLSFHSHFKDQFHQTISPYNMSNPVLLSVPYRFYSASLFVHGAEYLFICPLSIQLIFPILLHTHISKAFKRFISSFLMVHVSQPYRTTRKCFNQPLP